MRKRIVLLTLLLAGTALAWAGEVLHVHTVTGGEMVYDFADKPVVTFEADQMVLTTTTATVVYPMSEVTSFTFSHSEAEALEQITSSEPSGDATVRIYNLEGALVMTCEARDGVSAYRVNDLPQGAYVVRSGKRSYKMVKN